MMPEAPRILLLSTLATTLAVTGCGSTTTTPAAVAVVEVSPSASQVIVEAMTPFQATLKDVAGNLLFERLVSWRSGSPTVATVDADGVVSGVSSGQATITATSEGASGSALVTVRSKALIELSRSDVAFEAKHAGKDPDPERVAIANIGESPLLNLATSVRYLEGPSSWLAPSLSSTQAPSLLTLTATVLGLPKGIHRAEVDIVSSVAGNSPRTISVTFEVIEPPPEIRLSTDLVGLEAPEMSPTPVLSTVVVTNAGGDVLDELAVRIEYADGQPAGWLVATLSATKAPADLELAAAAGVLAPGTYTASVSVSAPDAANTPQSLTVSFTVVPRAAADATSDSPQGEGALSD